MRRFPRCLDRKHCSRGQTNVPSARRTSTQQRRDAPPTHKVRSAPVESPCGKPLWKAPRQSGKALHCNATRRADSSQRHGVAAHGVAAHGVATHGVADPDVTHRGIVDLCMWGRTSMRSSSDARQRMGGPLRVEDSAVQRGGRRCAQRAARAVQAARARAAQTAQMARAARATRAAGTPAAHRRAAAAGSRSSLASSSSASAAAAAARGVPSSATDAAACPAGLRESVAS